MFIKINFVILSALLINSSYNLKIEMINSPLVHRLTRIGVCFLVASMVCLIWQLSSKLQQTYQKLVIAQFEMKLNLFVQAEEHFREILEDFKNDGEVFTQYGICLLRTKDYRNAINVFLIAKRQLLTSDIAIGLAESYQGLYNYDSAEYWYNEASFMVPNRLYPHYLLVKLYDQTGETEKLLNKAKYLLEKDVKIESPASLQIKEEVSLILDKYKNQKAYD